MTSFHFIPKIRFWKSDANGTNWTSKRAQIRWVNKIPLKVFSSNFTILKICLLTHTKKNDFGFVKKREEENYYSQYNHLGHQLKHSVRDVWYLWLKYTILEIKTIDFREIKFSSMNSLRKPLFSHSIQSFLGKKKGVYHLPSL